MKCYEEGKAVVLDQFCNNKHFSRSVIFNLNFAPSKRFMMVQQREGLCLMNRPSPKQCQRMKDQITQKEFDICSTDHHIHIIDLASILPNDSRLIHRRSPSRNHQRTQERMERETSSGRIHLQAIAGQKLMMKSLSLELSQHHQFDQERD